MINFRIKNGAPYYTNIDVHSHITERVVTFPMTDKVFVDFDRWHDKGYLNFKLPKNNRNVSWIAVHLRDMQFVITNNRNEPEYVLKDYGIVSL